MDVQVSAYSRLCVARRSPDGVVHTERFSCGRECYVYQIPPLKNESGHRANDWDVNKWLWEGALKLTAKGATLYIILHDPNSGELFATCPVTAPGNGAVDQVIDSSLYFALRIDDGKGRHAFVGMGFRDRAHAYDFNATMQDHCAMPEIDRSLLLFRARPAAHARACQLLPNTSAPAQGTPAHRQMLAGKGQLRQKEADAIREEMAARDASEPMRDLSLKEGETLSIKVNVPGSGAKPRATRPKPAAGASAGPVLLAPPPKAGALAPPPKAASAPPSAPAEPSAPAAPAAGTAKPGVAVVDDDDFGDFSAGGNNDADDDGFGDFSSAS